MNHDVMTNMTYFPKLSYFLYARNFVQITS